MQEPVTLEYASARRWWTRRRKIWLALTVATVLGGSYLGYQGYREIRRRMTLLDKDPFIGPVDWWAVGKSPTLLGYAWRLSSGRSQGTWRLPVEGSDPVVEIVSEFARSPDVEIALERNVETMDDGTLRLYLTVANNGSKPAVVAPLRLNAGTWPLARPDGSESASRSLAMICSGVCLLRFIQSLLPRRRPSRRRAEDSHNAWISFWGARHYGLADSTRPSDFEWPLKPPSEIAHATEMRLYLLGHYDDCDFSSSGQQGLKALTPRFSCDGLAVDLSNRGAALLAQGVRLLRPGEKARLAVSVSGIGPEGSGIVILSAYRTTAWVVIENGIGTHWGEIEQTGSQGNLWAPYLPWPDAMLTPDEAQPKPWERLPNP